MRPRALAALAALALALAAACSSAGGTGPMANLQALEAQDEALQAARSRWSDRGPSDYELVVQRDRCECIPEWARPMRVVVRRGGAEVTVTDLETGAVRGQAYPDPPTVAGLHAVVEDALARRAAVLRVTYDEALGYPREIVVDYDAVAADDEFRITARDLRPLP